jgi:hypothetical protein
MTDEPNPDQLSELASGPLHRFADHASLRDLIPTAGAGVYTIWDAAGALVYVGVAGRNPAGKGLEPAAQPRQRPPQRRPVLRLRRRPLRAARPHARAVEAIRDSRLSFDALVRERIHASFSFRFVDVADYRAALALETAVKFGALAAGSPRLNPQWRSSAR